MEDFNLINCGVTSFLSLRFVEERAKATAGPSTPFRRAGTSLRMTASEWGTDFFRPPSYLPPTHRDEAAMNGAQAPSSHSLPSYRDVKKQILRLAALAKDDGVLLSGRLIGLGQGMGGGGKPCIIIQRWRRRARTEDTIQTIRQPSKASGRKKSQAGWTTRSLRTVTESA